ncbi:hypothetical protein Tco_1022315, partial [Tanacetum coccineum]
MTTLADKSLLSGGDNKPPMLEKHLYDSWNSQMELYMLNRPHGRMILASVEKGPLIWPSITEDGITRLKEYIKLTPAEAIQADCDIKAINIILQGLPTEIYALVRIKQKSQENRQKSNKHGHENGRVYKSRKPKSKSQPSGLISSKLSYWLISSRKDQAKAKKHKGMLGFTLLLLTEVTQ